MDVVFIEFNNKNSYEDFGMKILDKIIIPFPKKKYEIQSIPGADGDYYCDTGGYEDIVIPISFDVVEKNIISSKYRDLKRWLNDIIDNKLMISDDYEFFYRVKNIILPNDFETKFSLFGSVNVNFICEPYSYYKSGKQEIKVNNLIRNPGMKSKPIYRIVGEGLITLLINSRPIVINVGQEVIVNVEKELLYRNGQIENIRKKGSWDSLTLESGMNTISWNGNFNVYVTPNWRTY
ncbi:MAG: distal tail protein Dit [Clostridium sp.]